VHLWLHDVNRTGDRIPAFALQIVHRDQCRDHRIHQALADLVTVFVDNRRVRHQMAHVADQHERAAFVRDARAISPGKANVLIQHTLECFAAFGDVLGQIAFHQAEPVGVGQHLVFAIHRRNGVFAVHDRRHRRLEDDVRNACLVCAADGG